MLKDTNDRKPLNVQLVLDYHRIAARHEPEIAGKIRTISVYIKGNPSFAVARPETITERLDKEKIFPKQ